jgi:hypothetical protein
MFVCLFIPFNVLYESKTIVGRLSRLSLDKRFGYANSE